MIYIFIKFPFNNYIHNRMNSTETEYITYTLTLDHSILQTTIKDIYSKFALNKTQLEKLQLSNKSEELTHKLDDLRAEHNAKLLTQLNSIENIKAKLLSIEEKASTDTSAVKSLAIQRLDEQNSRSLKSFDKLQTSQDGLRKEFK